MADINNSLIRITESLQNVFGIGSVVPGSKLYQIAESAAYEAYINADTIDNFIYNNSLVSATGVALDQIGKNFFGINRIKATTPIVTNSMKAIKFYTNNGVTFGTINKVNDLANDIIIPEGTLITGTNNGISYTFRITSTITLPLNNTEAYIDAEMLSGDLNLIPANTLTSHNFVNYTTSSTKLLLVTNTVAIGTSSEEESDDNYRYRLMTSIKGRDVNSYYGIKNKLLTLSGVSNVEIINAAHGGGTFSVIVQGITPVTSLATLDLVESEIRNIVPPWVYFTVRRPNYIGITLTVGINSLSSDIISASVVNSIKSSVTNYINNFYGSYIEISKIQSIAQAAASSYSITINSLQLYSGEDGYRMFEEIVLDQYNDKIYIQQFDKIIVETDIYEPIKVEVNI